MKNLIRGSYDLSARAFVCMMHGTLPLLFTLFCCTGVWAQNPVPRFRLDPVFRSILQARRTGQDSLLRRSLSSRFNVTPAGALNTRTIGPGERYSCIVYTKKPQALRDSGIIVNSVLPNFVTALATLDQIEKMATMPDVSFIKAPKTLTLHNDVELGNSGASLLHAGRLNNTVYKGRNVITAIFDTGIDWDHPDFRNPADSTKSRILRIWDQTLNPVTGETSPSGFTYGVEYTQAQINDELDGTPANYVRERDVNGHGTHVAGTAAGNGGGLASRKYTGMAPEADLVIIKGGNGSFSSEHIIDALTYLQALSAALQKPVVLNMSLGGIISAHDGTEDEELAIDNFTRSGPGRSVVVAAGNLFSYLTPYQHNATTVSGSGNTAVTLTVPSGTTGSDVFTYLAYASDSGNVSATLSAPNGAHPITIQAGQVVSDTVMGSSFNVTMFNDVDFNNRRRYVYVQITRNGTNTANPSGVWSLALNNNTTGAMQFNGWLQPGSTYAATLLSGGDNNYTTNTPANASTAIAVGSYVSRLAAQTAANTRATYTTERQDSLSSFSCKGPRTDGVLKPEITAAGQGVISSLSSDVTLPEGVVTNTGLYMMLQGTSMSAPAVAGAVALLYQANPNTLHADIKTILCATASKDAFTELPGASPNNTWGYGKLDVFKAAAALFNCAQTDRRTYHYDSALRPPQYVSNVVYTTQRVAVRFTPDVSGKLAGFSFFTLPLSTNMFVEVRTNSSGRPGTLLATMNIDVNSILKTSMNYFDLSGLNVSVASGTDYFLVLARAAGSSDNWGLFHENVSTDGRTLTSPDEGVNWTTASYDATIRSVVYSSSQLTGPIVTTTSADTHDLNTSNSFLRNCALIATLAPNGTSPVAGRVTGNVWIESSVPLYGNDPFVARHYQISPATNASGATGRVTLYFTQAEFTAFNNDPRSALDLPANAADAMGKANLRIGKYAGSSNDGTGLPASYNGSAQIIDPDDSAIVWNADASRWEVSFAVTGFSGFVVQTKTTTLPVVVEYFNGKIEQTGNQLKWKVNCSGSAAVFEVQRSRNGFDFDSIGQLKVTPAACSLPMNFTDRSPAGGDNYYRIRITESNGAVRYTGVVLLRATGSLITVYPTVLNRYTPVQVNYTGVKGLFILTDGTGKQLYRHTLTNGSQSMLLPLHTGGLYFYTIKNDQGRTTGGKLLVR